MNFNSQVNPLFVGQSVALRFILLVRLQKTLSIYWSNYLRHCQAHSIPQSTLFRWHQHYNNLSQKIPLNRVKKDTLVYSSAIALQLAAILDSSAPIIAEEIQRLFNERMGQREEETSILLGQVLENSSASTSSQGWIYLEIAPTGLAFWLNALIEQFVSANPPTTGGFPPEQSNVRLAHSPALFQVQYTHARCCTLLRLAGLGTFLSNGSLNADGMEQASIQFTPPFPWLTPDATLRISHPNERRLIAQLVTTLDTLDELSKRSTPEQVTSGLVMAKQLSEQFQQFYAACRLWGEVKRTDPDRVHARLGLVLATQAVLRFLLASILQADAPTEL